MLAVEETVEHFVVVCGDLRETREKCGVYAGAGVEEALLFEGRTEERVERYTKMLDEMWSERRMLMDLVDGAGMEKTKITASLFLFMKIEAGREKKRKYVGDAIKSRQVKSPSSSTSSTLEPRTSYEKILRISSVHIRAEFQIYTVPFLRVLLNFYLLPRLRLDRITDHCEFVYHAFSEENKINIR